ncbi:amphi-Trp domain-containing protein [Natrononativus amylolyticus]|uniref:amphi-Trp domain-containing protein n=1 Tax=Natrononativus amylolyticus TaxID=2963434 RepID=UPI0020CF29F6|nr:amphi-Trp domain-containing protein [Natrononativus amylolyticus]
MADRTTTEETIPRPELAAYLEGLATEFERGGEEIAVSVGNKTVSLHPPENVDLSVEVVERSSVLRGERETIDIELSWKP